MGRSTAENRKKGRDIYSFVVALQVDVEIRKTAMGASASVLSSDVSFTKEEIEEVFKDTGFDGTFMYTKLKNASGEVSFSTLKTKCEEMSDCFLTHDWGKDEKGREN